MKAAIFDLDGNAVSSALKEYDLSYPEPGLVESDAESYWSACKYTIRAVLDRFGGDPKCIEALSIAGQGETFVVLDRDFKPIRKTIVWLDRRSSRECEMIEEQFGSDEIYKMTGQSCVMTDSTASKILWLRRNESKTIERAHKYLFLKDYLILRLTGETVTDKTQADSSLMETLDGTWWKAMLDFIGVSQGQLPEIRGSGEFVATIKEDAAGDTGLSTDTIVSTGAYDHAAGAVGAGNIRAGIVSECTGASLGIVATVGGIPLDPKIRFPCHHHAAEDMYFLNPGGMGGMILKWFRDEFGQAEVRFAKEHGVDAYDLLTQQASEVRSGSDGLIILPHFSGVSSPDPELKFKGTIFGLTLGHRKAHFVRALMESIAFAIRSTLEALDESKVDVHEVRSFGGGSSSPLWNQIKADVIQKPIYTLRTREVTCLGAAILGGVAAGLFKDIREGCESAVGTKDKYVPNCENTAIYNTTYHEYTDIFKTAKSLYKRW